MSLVVKTIPVEVSVDKENYIKDLLFKNNITNFSILRPINTPYAVLQLYDKTEISIFERKKLYTRFIFR